MSSSTIMWFEEIGIADVPAVGGKNASLGEMVRELAGAGVRVPEGFATAASAFREFVKSNGLASGMRAQLDRYHQGKASLAEIGKAIRSMFLDSEFPSETADAIRSAYRELCTRTGQEDLAVSSCRAGTAARCCTE